MIDCHAHAYPDPGFHLERALDHLPLSWADAIGETALPVARQAGSAIAREIRRLVPPSDRPPRPPRARRLVSNRTEPGGRSAPRARSAELASLEKSSSLDFSSCAT